MPNAGVTRRDFLRTSGVVAAAVATGKLLSGCGVSQAQSSTFWDNQSNTELTVELPSGALVKGYVAPAFRSVFDTFVANFAERSEIGTSLAITLKGTPVLEAWGGYSDTLAAKPSKPWTRDTVSLVFSCTKGATALCAHLLAARGQLDLDAPVSRYWPEFAANGKDKANCTHAARPFRRRSGIARPGTGEWLGGLDIHDKQVGPSPDLLRHLFSCRSMLKQSPMTCITRTLNYIERTITASTEAGDDLQALLAHLIPSSPTVVGGERLLWSSVPMH